MKFCGGSRNTLKIRKARIHDVPRLIELGKRFRLEAENYFPPVEEDVVWDNAHNIINDENHCHLVAIVDGEIVGWISGSLIGHIYSRVQMATQSILYVAPEHRNSRAGIRLINGFIEWAKRNGASRILMMDGADNDGPLGKILLRKGFEKVGALYWKY